MITGKIDCGLLIFRSCSQLQITAFQKRSYTKLHKKGRQFIMELKGKKIYFLGDSITEGSALLMQSTVMFPYSGSFPALL